MKKKMLTVVIVIIAVIVLVFVGWYVMFVHFGRGPAFPFLKVQKMNIESMDRVMIADNSLMSEAETEEKAREIAEQYGIELVSFENGIALYHTEEDPFEVIARGQENGYAQLSVNFIRTEDDTD
ncbi:MAG: hypothetical protein HDR06_08935 [Lachnospiraceae bacterium]|nr:hypothetical protein [Lachnospiraceae bacterium]